MSVSLLKKSNTLLVHDLFDKIISLNILEKLGKFDVVVLSELCGNSYFYNTTLFRNSKLVCLDKMLSYMHSQNAIGLITHSNLYTCDHDFAKRYDKKLLSDDEITEYEKLLELIGSGRIVARPQRTSTKYLMTFHRDLTYEVLE